MIDAFDALFDLWGRRPDTLLRPSRDEGNGDGAARKRSNAPEHTAGMLLSGLVGFLWQWDGEVEAPAHATAWHRISIRFGGVARYERTVPGGGRIVDHGGAVSVHPAGAAYGNVISGHMHFLTLCLSPARLLGIAEEEEGWRRPADQGPEPVLDPVFTAVDSVVAGAGRVIAANAGIFGRSALFRDSMERLIARRLLATLTGFEHRPQSRAKDGRPHEPGIANAMALMVARLDEDLGLETLAAAADLPPGRFLAAFRSVTGQTPQAYLAGLRIDAARRLIMQSGLSFGEIARRTGFRSPAALSMACRRQFGVSPRVLRASG